MRKNWNRRKISDFPEIKTTKELQELLDSEGNPKGVDIIEEFKGWHKKLKCKCKAFGHEFELSPFDIMDNQGCYYCSGHRILKGFNSIGDKRPDLIKYFVNEEDAFKYGPGSDKYVKAKCPLCGYEEERRVKEITRAGGVACKICSKNKVVSIPNRFIRNIILLRKDMLEDFKFEYGPEWIPKGTRYRYDAYFKYKEKTYICELDGLQHNTGIFLGKPINVKENDKLKEEFAKGHIDYFIRIKSYRNDLNYLKKEFKESILQNIFKITEEEFEQIWLKCQDNMFEKVIKMANENPDMKIPQIAKEFMVSVMPIKTILKRGNKLGLCDYKFIKYNSVPVKMINMETKEEIIFYSASDCSKYLKIVSSSSIRNYVKDKKVHHGFIFEKADKTEFDKIVDINTLKV